ncbi:MAG: hypothetical protein AAF193_02910 [Bacteroidota bacterium]
MGESLDEFLESTGFGPLDKATLESKDEYEAYFEYVQRAFSSLIGHLENEEKHSKEGRIIQTTISFYLTKLLRSIELLNLNYRFDSRHDVKIDLTESSFPNHTELRKMKADHALKDSWMSQSADTLRLKDKLLEHLRTKDEEPLVILDALSKKRYFNQLFPPSLFLMFNEGKLLRNLQKASSGRMNYVYSVATYNPPTNRPIIYLFTIEYEGEQGDLESDNRALDQLRRNVEVVTQGARKPYDIMTYLDQELENIYPKVLRKFDIGPLYGKYSKDLQPLTEFYHRNQLGDQAFIIQYEEETVVSSGEEKVKAKWLKSPRVLQKYHVDKQDPTCAERKISSYKKHLLAPHKVIQVLYDDPKCEGIVQELRNNFIPV